MWELKNLCDNSRARPSGAKAVVIWRQLRHGLSRALTTNQDATQTLKLPPPMENQPEEKLAEAYVLGAEAYAY